ncbi:uncharacterized protein BHQ10_006419 [Talaromyces amestolkiae]|uniref:Uncharacterized protein n=1 Tax=Talaromyces amestolkiae TaxID=1196081 RepID=A0A364L3M1_TALAM|nr:uncharacterized protein BHQ10_006419 [Talaromyces amestolkiae]RAO70407.1 hypothetical protein BHQ10_006419 [Talaromyces amestolkiae]
MGTRNLICIWYKGRFMVAQYCQWDGYLEGQGANILQFLLVPSNIERLKKGLTRITPVDDQTVQDILGKHRYSTYKNNKKVCECGAAVSFQEQEKCFPSTLNRDTGAKILDIIAAARPDDYIPIQLSLEFAVNGLFCEYCYCVDLDAEVFEVFGGATYIPTTTDDDKTEQIGQNRFVEVCRAAEGAPLMGKSMPALLKSWPLAELPKDMEDMVRQVAADNEESEYVEGEHDDSEDDVESDTEDDGKDTDDEKTNNDDKPADNGDDKKSQEAGTKKPDVVDKKTIDDDAQKPADQDKEAAVPDEYEDSIYEERSVFKYEKENAEHKERLDSKEEDLAIEAAQLSIKMECERAAMRKAGGSAGDITLSIQETE